MALEVETVRRAVGLAGTLAAPTSSSVRTPNGSSRKALATKNRK